MAVLNPKPFVVAEKIFRRLFKGKPSIFADVDINQQSLIDDQGFKIISSALGGYSTGFNPILSGLLWNGVQMSYTVSSLTGAKLNYNKIEFDIPSFSLTGSNVPVMPAPGYAGSVVNFWLVAEKYTTSFVDDNVLAGIDGPGLGSALPSSDAIRYKNEVVVRSVGSGILPILTTGQEVISLLCQIAFKYVASTDSYQPYLQKNVINLGEFNLKAFPNPFYNTDPSGVIGNLLSFIDYFEQQLQNFYYTLYNALVERQGTVKYFYGDINTNFDPSGLGIGQWSGYALCNGATHGAYTTPDIRGKNIIGFHSLLGDAQNEYKTIGEVGPIDPLDPNSYSLVYGGKKIKQGNLCVAPHRHIDSQVISFEDQSNMVVDNWASRHLTETGGLAIKQYYDNSQRLNNSDGDFEAGDDHDTFIMYANTGNGMDNIDNQDVTLSFPMENRSPYIVLAVVIKL